MAWLNFLESICFLEKNNIKVNPEIYLIDSIKKLNKFNNFPYVLKLSSDIIHKTEENLVKDNLYTKKQLLDSYKQLQNYIQKNNLKDSNIILQKQIKGLELIIGLKKDNQFNQILVFGMGGIFTEIFNDTTIKILPVNYKDINSMIKSLKIYKILKGYRNKTYDLKSLKKILKQISDLNKNNQIKELDLNPVIINENGIYIVDARIKI